MSTQVQSAELQRLVCIPQLLRHAPGTPIERLTVSGCQSPVLFSSDRHEATEPLDIPIFAFGGADDVRVPLHDVFAWRKLTSAYFDARVFPGGHFFIRAHMDSILEAILERSIGSGRPAEPARV